MDVPAHHGHRLPRCRNTPIARRLIAGERGIAQDIVDNILLREDGSAVLTDSASRMPATPAA